ncbi:ATP-binding protein [Ramlibacter humi]|uniref:ATP-binding protein n=1 Tax=Ramlibacter humi TaxID=2530451 RepID=A0A4Z0BEF9_9BURK|nr:ATP-binding protein [Ramlibacter humi]TFY96707.1 ATP-binding protein [Ramlibacter humi]
MQDLEFSLPATLADVAQATQRVRDWLPAWLDTGERDAVELALAEALTNIVEHGYAGLLPQDIRVRLVDRPGALEVDVWDRGHPIPLRRLEEADDTTFQFDPTDLEALPEGGMGLALIKAAFQEVRYRRRQGVNRLHLVRRM